MREKKGLMYDCISLVNRNYKKTRCDTFKKVFVCACRKGQSLNKEYDIIIGNVADDDVFKTVDMYFRGLWDKEKVLGELRYYKMNNQICIVNQETLDRLVIFKESYEVANSDK